MPIYYYLNSLHTQDNFFFHSMIKLKRASSVNVCTTAFKLSFQYSIVFLSQVCRWASCRGSLPQPIVVFLLAASALSAPRRRRLLTVGITLIALRTIAEMLHGYIHDDWDEEDEGTEDSLNNDETIKNGITSSRKNGDGSSI